MAFESNAKTGTTIVRRFTDQLNGTTELEKATIAAQERFDAKEEEALDLRLRSYFEGTGDDSS